MPKRILSVSYDVSLLATRRMLLEERGYEVTSALEFTQAVAHCRNAKFDLLILGHTLPNTDKIELMRRFRASCPAPILSLERPGQDGVSSDFHASPDDPEKFLEVVNDILAGKKQ